MSLHDRIKEARKNRGLTQEQLGELIGVAKTTVTGYEKNREPSAAKVGEIADILGVDVNFLFQDEVKELHENHATPEEFETIIKKYRNLDDYGRETINIVLDRETTRVTSLRQKDKRITELESQPTAVIDFPVRSNQAARIAEYFRSASAGGGVFILGNEATSKIIVSEADWDDRIDYVISVSGHSMEPDYNDGDKVMVSQRLEMHHGDVGIFVINGKAYIKEYGEKELISRNPESDNIKISEYDNIVCMGKVIGKLKGQYEIIDD